jgi:hypothetical protein
MKLVLVCQMINTKRDTLVKFIDCSSGLLSPTAKPRLNTTATKPDQTP